MNPFSKLLATLVSLVGVSVAQAECGSVLNHQVRELAGERIVNLCEAYQGQVLLIVNTASKCAFTGQYEGLEALHARFHQRGFSVLGFPSGDFADQEYQQEGQIQEFCRLTYGVQFPMFEKSHVRGTAASPLWKELIAQSGTSPKWNFYKYLIGRDGRVIASFSSMTSPDSGDLLTKLEAALAEPTTNP